MRGLEINDENVGSHLFINRFTAIRQVLPGPGKKIRMPGDEYSTLPHGKQIRHCSEEITDAVTVLGGHPDRTFPGTCLLYTSDAADDLLCVDLGGRRIIKKKTQHSIRI